MNQAAVALHYQSTGNSVGACSLLERSRKNLAAYPEDFGGIRLAALILSLSAWREALLSGRPKPAFPKVHRTQCESAHVICRRVDPLPAAGQQPLRLSPAS